MASNLFWYYDACVLGIGLIYLYVGAKRGFMRSAVLIVLTIASIVLSWLAGTIFAPVVYENFVKDRIMEGVGIRLEEKEPEKTVTDTVNGGDYGVEMTGDEVGSIISQGGDFFNNIAAALKTNGAGESVESLQTGIETGVTEEVITIIVGDKVSPKVLKDILNSVSGAEKSLKTVVDCFVGGNRQKTSEMIEAQIIAPAVTLVIKGIIWIICTSVLMIISKSIANAFKGLNKVPLIGPVNVLLGAALGLIEGLVVIYIISQIVKLICYVTSNSLMFLNSDTVAQTRIFKEFYNFVIT